MSANLKSISESFRELSSRLQQEAKEEILQWPEFMKVRESIEEAEGFNNFESRLDHLMADSENDE